MLWGLVIGILAALPLALAVRRVSMAAGIAALMASFALYHVGIIALWQLASAELVPGAVVSAVAFLAVVIAAALRRRA